MKQFLALLGFIGLLILGTGLYLGHITLGKLEKAHQQAVLEKDQTIADLKSKIVQLEQEKKSLKLPEVKVEPIVNNDNKILEQLLAQSQKNLLLEDEVKKMNEKLSGMEERCVINPKPVSKPKVYKAYKPVAPKPKEPLKVSEKPQNSNTIIINKVYVTDKSGNPKLMKEQRKILPKEYYPNDLLK